MQYLPGLLYNQERGDHLMKSIKCARCQNEPMTTAQSLMKLNKKKTKNKKEKEERDGIHRHNRRCQGEIIMERQRKQPTNKSTRA